MRAADIRALYDYHYWANGRILGALAQIDHTQFVAPAAVPWGSLRGTLVHLLWAETNWLARWEGRPTLPRFAEEEFPTVADLRAGWSASEAALRAFLVTLDDARLDAPFHYTRTNGEPRSQIFWQLLVHIVNHGTQHHTEAAILLTRYGASPGDIDLHLSPLGQPAG